MSISTDCFNDSELDMLTIHQQIVHLTVYIYISFITFLFFYVKPPEATGNSWHFPWFSPNFLAGRGLDPGAAGAAYGAGAVGAAGAGATHSNWESRSDHFWSVAKLNILVKSM